LKNLYNMYRILTQLPRLSFAKQSSHLISMGYIPERVVIPLALGAYLAEGICMNYLYVFIIALLFSFNAFANSGTLSQVYELSDLESPYYDCTDTQIARTKNYLYIWIDPEDKKINVLMEPYGWGKGYYSIRMKEVGRAKNSQEIRVLMSYGPFSSSITQEELMDITFSFSDNDVDVRLNHYFYISNASSSEAKQISSWGEWIETSHSNNSKIILDGVVYMKEKDFSDETHTCHRVTN